MKYQLIERPNRDSLQTAINAAAEDGWRLVTFQQVNGQKYLAAMEKPDA